MARLGMVMAVALLVASVASANVANWELDEGAGQRYACSVTGTQGYLGDSSTGDAAEPLWSVDTHDGSAYSLDFDGTDDFAYHNHTGVDAIDGEFSVSADVKVDAFDERSTYVLCHNTKFALELWEGHTSNWGNTYRPLFWIYNQSGTKTQQYSTTYLNTGTWYDIECKYTGTEMQIWIDGVHTDTLAYTGGVRTGYARGVTLGTYGGGAGCLDGKIDNVVITPEPATMVLLGLGGVGMLIRRRRRV